jgi:hypothetical protein
LRHWTMLSANTPFLFLSMWKPISRFRRTRHQNATTVIDQIHEHKTSQRQGHVLYPRRPVSMAKTSCRYTSRLYVNR